LTSMGSLSQPISTPALSKSSMHREQACGRASRQHESQARGRNVERLLHGQPHQ
jgi:hypothetical protein